MHTRFYKIRSHNTVGVHNDNQIYINQTEGLNHTQRIYVYHHILLDTNVAILTVLYKYIVQWQHEYTD